MCYNKKYVTKKCYKKVLRLYESRCYKLALTTEEKQRAEELFDRYPNNSLQEIVDLIKIEFKDSTANKMDLSRHKKKINTIHKGGNAPLLKKDIKKVRQTVRKQEKKKIKPKIDLEVKKKTKRLEQRVTNKLIEVSTVREISLHGLMNCINTINNMEDKHRVNYTGALLSTFKELANYEKDLYKFNQKLALDRERFEFEKQMSNRENQMNNDIFNVQLIDLPKEDKNETS